MPHSLRGSLSSFDPELHHQGMRRRKPNKKPNSRPALCLLVFCGCAIVFFALVLIGCCFAINYADDLDFDNDKLDAKIRSRFHYDQYWAGVTFLVTGILVMLSAIFQRSRGLTISSVIFCIISFALTLFVVALDGFSLSYWYSLERSKAYWDSKSDYSCGTDSASKACTCETSTSPEVISEYECNILQKMSALYGAVVASAIMVSAFALATIAVIINSLSWKPPLYTSHSYYNTADEFYVDYGRRTPSFIDLPVPKRRNEYAEHSTGTKALSHRNYPF